MRRTLDGSCGTARRDTSAPAPTGVQVKPYRITFEPESKPRPESRPWVLRKRHGAGFLKHAWKRFASLAQAHEAIRDHELAVELRRGLGGPC